MGALGIPGTPSSVPLDMCAVIGDFYLNISRFRNLDIPTKSNVIKRINQSNGHSPILILSFLLHIPADSSLR